MRMAKLLGVMAEKGVTQGMLAQALGISKNTMSRIINRKAFLTTDKVEIACDFLGIDDDAMKAEIFLS